MKVEETDPLDSAWPLNTFLPSKGVEKEIRAISPLSWPFFPSFPRIRGKTRLVCRLFWTKCGGILGRRRKAEM